MDDFYYRVVMKTNKNIKLYKTRDVFFAIHEYLSYYYNFQKNGMLNNIKLKLIQFIDNKYLLDDKRYIVNEKLFKIKQDKYYFDKDSRKFVSYYFPNKEIFIPNFIYDEGEFKGLYPEYIERLINKICKFDGKNNTIKIIENTTKQNDIISSVENKKKIEQELEKLQNIYNEEKNKISDIEKNLKISQKKKANILANINSDKRISKKEEEHKEETLKRFLNNLIPYNKYKLDIEKNPNNIINIPPFFKDEYKIYKELDESGNLNNFKMYYEKYKNLEKLKQMEEEYEWYCQDKNIHLEESSEESSINDDESED